MLFRSVYLCVPVSIFVHLCVCVVSLCVCVSVLCLCVSVCVLCLCVRLCICVCSLFPELFAASEKRIHFLYVRTLRALATGHMCLESATCHDDANRQYMSPRRRQAQKSYGFRSRRGPSREAHLPTLPLHPDVCPPVPLALLKGGGKIERQVVVGSAKLVNRVQGPRVLSRAGSP